MNANDTGASTKAGAEAIAKAPLISHNFNLRMLSPRKAPTWCKGKSGTVSQKYWNYPLVTRRAKEPTWAVGKAGHVSTKWWSYPLLSAPKTRDSAVGKAEFVSQKFWKYPLLSKDKKRDSAVGKARLIMTDSLVGKH
jgi:hypothetical protein